MSARPFDPYLQPGPYSTISETLEWQVKMGAATNSDRALLSLALTISLLVDEMKAEREAGRGA